MIDQPRARAIALLSASVEARLADLVANSPEARVDPWDVWWACTRADLPAPTLGLDTSLSTSTCARCAADVARLTRRMPLPRLDPDAWSTCGCMASWARAMRTATRQPDWPGWRVTLAVIKPATDRNRAEKLIASTFRVLSAEDRQLTADDTRRLYPDAYGGPFLARQIAFLISEPVRIMVLLARERMSGPAHRDAKRSIRRRLGVGDDLRNHVHMPDNPGEAWCDVMHLAGATLAQQLYEEYEGERAADNLAVYRRVLERWTSSTDAHRP